MTRFIGDIDVDLPDRDRLLKRIHHVPASQLNGEDMVRHNVGVYVQNIPMSPMNGCATLTYKEAEALGYQKIDLINNSVYEDIDDMIHMDMMADVNMVQWEMLEHEDFVKMLPHIANHIDVVASVSPRSVEELAIVLALIRPAKKHLVGCSWDEIQKNVWVKPTDGSYYFKKSHSFAFALSIVVKMNLICSTI